MEKNGEERIEEWKSKNEIGEEEGEGDEGEREREKGIGQGAEGRKYDTSIIRLQVQYANHWATSPQT